MKQENQNTYILRQDLSQSIIASQSDVSQVFHYNKCKQSLHIWDNQNISKVAQKASLTCLDRARRAVARDAIGSQCEEGSSAGDGTRGGIQTLLDKTT